jgi:predicted RNA-binding Zn-ribbon protein involved in translation (DUF1610 family)
MEKIIQKCPQCGAEMKFIPAGVSKKTGKEYKAFFSCPNCGYTLNAPDDVAQRFANQKPETEQERIERLAREKQERIQQLHQEKTENINWVSAMKEAIELIANHPVFKDIADEHTLWTKVLAYRDLIYKEYTKEDDEIVEGEDLPVLESDENNN